MWNGDSDKKKANVRIGKKRAFEKEKKETDCKRSNGGYSEY